MNPTPSFQLQQRQLLNHLRRPQACDLPAGFAPERVAVYVDLLFNKFDESLSACFPIIRRILSQSAWRALILDFIAEHRCRTPYYRQIPDEFVQYLFDERTRPDDPPFLTELAHYEWMELQLSIAEAEPFAVESLTEAQLLAEIPVFAPVAQLLSYQWPVQDINPAFLPTEPSATMAAILGFRDVDDRVQFIALSPLSARLAVLLGEGLTGRQALESIASELNVTDFEPFLRFGLDTLVELHRRGAIIATRPASDL